MIYNPFTCDLIAVGATNEIYRLNLGIGRFQNPLESDSEEINCCAFSNKLQLLATGGTDGKVQFWDMKERKSCITLPLNDNGPGAAFFSMGEITKVDFSADSYQVAFGNEKGKV